MSQVEVMRKGSKSFYLATLFFPREKREYIFSLYSWCRYCDDAIDIERMEIKELERRTKEVWESGVTVGEGPFQSLQQVVSTYQIPKEYPLDLLKGMELDTLGTRFQTVKDLERYCYYVAGTVGLMMCHVMGLFRESALDEAVALGKAMQLTNIARDVREDFENGRVYLPLDWLEEAGIEPSQMWEIQNREKLFEIVLRLIAASEDFYKTGRKGIIHLPLRPAIAVTIASLIYREIGRKIKRVGIQSIEQRTVVSPLKKFILVMQGLFEICLALPIRCVMFRTKKTLFPVWRPS